MGIFNPDTFLDTSVGGEMSTERLVIPEGFYPAYIKELKPQEGIISKGKREGEPWASMNFVWVIEDPEVKAALKKDEAVCTQRVFLDLDAAGNIDTSEGKNVDLGRIRKTLGVNSGEVRWGDFIAKRATIHVTVGESANGKFNDVKGAAPLEA